jgi:hypothetical protein
MEAARYFRMLLPICNITRYHLSFLFICLFILTVTRAVHSALVRINEELLERKVAAPV